MVSLVLALSALPLALSSLASLVAASACCSLNKPSCGRECKRDSNLQICRYFYTDKKENARVFTACECCVNTNRRRLEVLDADYPSLADKCGGLDYQLYIAVEFAHIYLLAEPVSTDIIEECLPVGFHLPEPSRKEIRVLDASDFGEDFLYPVGVHKFDDLLKAYDNSRTSAEPYDIVTNNCARIVLDMFCYLDVTVEKEMLDWTADKLMATEESAGMMMRNMMDSPNVDQMDIGSNETLAAQTQEENKEDMGTLVTYYVENYGTCPAIAKNSPSPTKAPFSFAAALLIGAVSLLSFWAVIH